MFKNLKYKQLKSLIEIISATKEKSFALIKQRFLNASENFDEAKEFLKALNILHEQNDVLILHGKFKDLEEQKKTIDDFIKPLLLRKLMNVNGPLYKTVRGYLDNFKVSYNGFEYVPSNAANIRESWLRNLFMELELIEYYADSGTYQISKKYTTLFEDSLNSARLSPEELTVLQIDREKIGTAAELVVLQFEKKRLSDFPELIEKMEHVARYNVSAGYDILSWETERQTGELIPRYIEVKAVSKLGTNFFWTCNEVTRAKLYAEKYHLYILPVIGSNEFDIVNMEIIPNPIVNIFNNTKDWEYRTETYLFNKK